VRAVVVLTCGTAGHVRRYRSTDQQPSPDEVPDPRPWSSSRAAVGGRAGLGRGRRPGGRSPPAHAAAPGGPARTRTRGLV